MVHPRTAPGRAPGGVAYDPSPVTSLTCSEGCLALETAYNEPGCKVYTPTRAPVPASTAPAGIAPVMIFVGSPMKTIALRGLHGMPGARAMSTPAHHPTVISPFTDKSTGKAHFPPGTVPPSTVVGSSHGTASNYSSTFEAIVVPINYYFAKITLSPLGSRTITVRGVALGPYVI